MSKNPLVSVCCITYNHQDFIEQCLDGFLMQEVNFDLEFLIHDDASTDRTQEIITAKVSHDKRFKLILRTENLKSTGKAIFPILFEQAQGKYIAMCEGDDYWIDPYKLQKQVDFLEKNEDYILTHSDAEIFIENTGRIYESANKLKKKTIKSGDVFIEKLLWNYRIFTCTALFRNSEKISLIFQEHENYPQGDLILFLELFRNGLVKFFNESTGVYRVNKKSATQSLNELQRWQFKLSSINIRLRIAKKYQVEKKIIDKLNVIHNEVLLELYYLQNNRALMKKVELFFNIEKIKLTWQQKYKMSIVLDDGIKVVIYKFIFIVINFMTTLTKTLSDFKNKNFAS